LGTGKVLLIIVIMSISALMIVSSLPQDVFAGKNDSFIQVTVKQFGSNKANSLCEVRELVKNTIIRKDATNNGGKVRFVVATALGAVDVFCDGFPPDTGNPVDLTQSKMNRISVTIP